MANRMNATIRVIRNKYFFTADQTSNIDMYLGLRKNSKMAQRDKYRVGTL